MIYIFLGYENGNVTEDGLNELTNSLVKDKNKLECLDINLDGWASDYKNEASLSSVSDNIVVNMFQ